MLHTKENNTLFLILVWTDIRCHIVAENIRERMVFSNYTYMSTFDPTVDESKFQVDNTPTVKFMQSLRHIIK